MTIIVFLHTLKSYTCVWDLDVTHAALLGAE